MPINTALDPVATPPVTPSEMAFAWHKKARWIQNATIDLKKDKDKDKDEVPRKNF
jgi:hypothetical protein